MNANGNSDEFVVPATSANSDRAERSTESSEERDSAKRNTDSNALSRTPSRNKRRSRGLNGVREAAQKDSMLNFTALLHHVHKGRLTKAFSYLKKNVASGVDGVSWQDYEQNLEVNIADLHGRIHRGAYRASPSRRVRIPKPDGRQRLLGIATLEDKIVQQAVLWVLQEIYEADFLGFSYGFRPRRSQHDALDALSVAITTHKVNWILDADIASFFDEIDHSCLIKFLEYRIGDPRILRLIRKWLTAGVIEDGVRSPTTSGTPQGAVISPLLSNVFLHYVFDLWIDWWRKEHCHGDVIVVRYADDFVIGFESHTDAERCLSQLRLRFAQLGLGLHKDKTRLIEFGRHAIDRRNRCGEGRPQTFDFLGFTHRCDKTRKTGRFIINRASIAKRVRATLQAIKQELRKRMHHPLRHVGTWLGRVVRGWLQYHAIPSNGRRLQRFVEEVKRLWLKVIRRRSEKGRKWTWARFTRLARRYLPTPRILHPYPNDRFRAKLEARAV